jgi:hypothetical protein
MTFHRFTSDARARIEQLREAMPAVELQVLLEAAFRQACARQPDVRHGQIEVADIEAAIRETADLADAGTLTPYDGIVAIGPPDLVADDLQRSRIYDAMPIEPEQESPR